jgi:hypothetical protein
MKLSDFVPGDRIRVVPESTAFDLPVWTIRETGVVLSLGTKRVKVQLDGSSKAIYAVDPKDLQRLDPVARPKPVQPQGELTSLDWELIRQTLERADRLKDAPHDRLRELAAKVDNIRPCSQIYCPNPADPYASGAAERGLCRSCILENKLASLLPEEFDGDEGQDAILERAVEEMAKLWEAAKKLREQCEREETSVYHGNWYLWTKEIRGIMGWTETDEDGHPVAYYFTLAGDKDE